MAAQVLSSLADHDPADLGKVEYPRKFPGNIYYSAPRKGARTEKPDEVDPKLLETYQKLGIPLQERGRLAGWRWTHF